MATRITTHSLTHLEILSVTTNSPRKVVRSTQCCTQKAGGPDEHTPSRNSLQYGVPRSSRVLARAGQLRVLESAWVGFSFPSGPAFQKLFQVALPVQHGDRQEE